MLNGQSLEKVIAHCVPGIKNVKKIMLPDLDAVFVAIKLATTGQGYPMDRKCPQCQHENTMDLNCQHLLDTMSRVEDSDCLVDIDGLKVYVRPYNFSMRNTFLQKQFEEQNIINQLGEDVNEFERGQLIAESVERLVSNSIEKIVTPDGIVVEDSDQLTEWIFNITSNQANAVIDQVNALNAIGIQKTYEIVCEECQHTWSESVEFDPISFFDKRL